MNIKQFAIATFFALVLLTVASAPLSGQQFRGAYDPWLDYNEDGRIDVEELHSLGEVYGSSGDLTKNVTITGHATQYVREGGMGITIPASTHWFSDLVSIEGYAKVTVLVRLSTRANCYLYIHAFDNDGYSWLLETVDPESESWVKTYDVMNQRMKIEIENSNPSPITGELAFYLST